MPESVLIDVRTPAEWDVIGVPDLTSIDKAVVFAEWDSMTHMVEPAAFVDGLKARIPADRSTPLLFLCKVGGRSMSAAQAMAMAGYERCFNIVHGFEGDAGPGGRRGAVNGWQADGLPWTHP